MLVVFVGVYISIGCSVVFVYLFVEGSSFMGRLYCYFLWFGVFLFVEGK